MKESISGKKIVVSTTYGWNPGDDFIREGVFRLLGLPGPHSVAFMNRLQVKKTRNILFEVLFRLRNKHPAKYAKIPLLGRMDELLIPAWKPLWKCQGNLPRIDELFSGADLFLVAGSPEWIKATEKAYRLCEKRRIPVVIVGVGMEWTDFRPDGLDARRVALATTRDEVALRRLGRFGIPASRWPDPAVFCVGHRPEKSLDIVLGYREDVRKDRVFRRICERFKDRIDAIVVNEQGDYVRAEKLFDAPVYYNSDYRKLLDVLSDAKVYIGGRIHGAIPCFAAGGASWLMYHERRGDLVEDLRDDMRKDGVDPSIRLLSYDEKDVDALDPDETGDLDGSRQWVESAFARYRDYLRESLRDVLP